MSEPQPMTVDANVLLRYLVPDHPEHYARALKVMQAMDSLEQPLICNPVTLSEVVFTLSSYYGFDRARIAEGLLPIVQSDGFHIVDKPLYMTALRLYATVAPHFGDACACATALEGSEGRLLSFDRKLSSVPGIERTE